MSSATLTIHMDAAIQRPVVSASYNTETCPECGEGYGSIVRCGKCVTCIECGWSLCGR